uniref:PABC domain-containing protein n=1 Tax=Paramormyrops kingsleyae TaxID=1676925 RepID=A0A3B3RPZ3_9TELE
MEEEEDVEELGERLYKLIYPGYSNMAGKLTGMLLELPSSVLAQMLQDETMLATAVEKALSALQPSKHTGKMEAEGEDAVSASSDSLGEQLYELVDTHNTGFTEKITGMLLEQRKKDVQKLLSDPGLLEEGIKVALKTLEEQNSTETDVSDCSDPDDIDRMGEKLFAIVQQIDAKNCADITGMLLEMEPKTLGQLFCDRSMLEAAVKRAQAAIVRAAHTAIAAIKQKA